MYQLSASLDTAELSVCMAAGVGAVATPICYLFTPVAPTEYSPHHPQVEHGLQSVLITGLLTLLGVVSVYMCLHASFFSCKLYLLLTVCTSKSMPVFSALVRMVPIEHPSNPEIVDLVFTQLKTKTCCYHSGLCVSCSVFVFC